MTLCIIELARLEHDGKIAGPLLGMVEIGKRNILQVALYFFNRCDVKNEIYS